MRWADVDPALAQVVRTEFKRRDVVIVGTLTADGSPRVSAVDTCFLDDELVLAMMWQSRKAVDLLRDPRLVLHSPICSNTGRELEAIVRGRANDVRDEGTRERYLRTSGTPWEGRFHLFSVDVEAVSTIRYEGGEQHVVVWPKGKEFRRPYG
jgi:hypothetical protein